MSKFITAKNIAIRDGFSNAQDWVIEISKGLVERGILAKQWSGLISGKPIAARIDYGRWIADCPYCKGAEYVDLDNPFLFCLSCGMAGNNNLALPVLLPKNIDQIEQALSERPINDRRGANDVERALLSTPYNYGLSRSWFPYETVDDIRRQNLDIKYRNKSAVDYG